MKHIQSQWDKEIRIAIWLSSLNPLKRRRSAEAALRRQHIATAEAAIAIAHTSPSPLKALVIQYDLVFGVFRLEISVDFAWKFTYLKVFWYSSPSQLRYPQLSYFRSNAILNWVQKNSS